MKTIVNMVNPALWDAARDGRADDVDGMCGAGYDKEECGGGALCTPLLIAAQMCNFNCIKVLVENNANLDAVDKEQRTALHLIAFGDLSNTCYTERDRGEIALRLINGSATTSIKTIVKRVNALDDQNYTPITYAVIHNKTNLVELLCEKGADMCTTDHLGSTLLHHAVETHNIPIASYLLGPGRTCREQLNQTNMFGDSALKMAVFYACNKNYLNTPTIDGGADGTRPDEGGMVRLLLDHGADFPSYANVVVTPNDRRIRILTMLKEEPYRREIEYCLEGVKLQAHSMLEGGYSMYNGNGDTKMVADEPLYREGGFRAEDAAIEILVRCIQAEDVFLVNGCGIRSVLNIIAGLDPVEYSHVLVAAVRPLRMST